MKNLFGKYGISLSDEQEEKFDEFSSLLKAVIRKLYLLQAEEASLKSLRGS